MIGSKFSRLFFNQSEVKPKPIVARACTFFHALCRLRLITSSFDCCTGLSPSFLIGQSNHFGFDFTTLIRKPLHLHIRCIPRALCCRAYSSVWQEEGVFCLERLAVISLSSPPLLPTVYQCDGCISFWGHGSSWLVCQVWPSIGAVSILELAANSGSYRRCQASNLH